MDPVSAVGVVAATVAFIDGAAKIVKRLADSEGIPKEFQEIGWRLPVILNVVRRTQDAAGALDAQTAASLEAIVRVCHNHVHELHDILQRTAVTRSDSAIRRGVKAAVLLKEEAKIRRIASSLRDNIGLLTLLNVAPAEREKVAAQSRGSETPRPSARPGRVFLLPFVQDLQFVGREKELSSIRDAFATQKRVAISGIGGIGKSQVAIEYCYRFSKSNQDAHIFWVYGGSLARFYQGYKRIAQKLQLPSWDDPNTSILELVSDWFAETTATFLLVLDNADDISIYWPEKMGQAHSVEDPVRCISTYLPGNAESGHFLVTTRDNRIAGRLASHTVALDPISKDDAMSLFTLKAGDSLEKPDECVLERLVVKLDCLPLAISQAAAFIEENDGRISDYLDALEGESPQEYIDEELHDPRRDRESVNSVFRTWKLSIDQISLQKPQAADLLCLLSMLDRQSIPKLLLPAGPKLATSIGTLRAFNLITIRPGSGSLQLHRLVQKFVQLSWKSSSSAQKWENEALACVARAYPTEIGREEWWLCDTLAPHVQVVISREYESGEARLDLAHLLCWAADFDIERGMYAQGLARAERSRAIFQEELANEIDNRLAAATWMCGRLRYYVAESEDDINDAADMLETALRIADYPSLPYAEAAFELAHLYYRMRNEEACLEMGRASYECWKAMDGPTSERALDNLDDHALAFALFGRVEEAIAKWQEIVELSQACDTDENTKAVYLYRSMASVAEFQGDESTAELLFAKLVGICSAIYSEDHVHVFDYRLMHAEQILRQGRPAEAMRVTEVIMEAFKNKSDWEILASCLQILAECCRMQASAEEEETYRLQFFELHAQMLGRRHHTTIDAMGTYAQCLTRSKRHAEAELLCQEVIALLKLNPSASGEKMANAYETLGLCLALQGRHAEAEAAYLDALDQDEKSPRLLRNLCCLLWRQQKWDLLEFRCRQVQSMGGGPRPWASWGLITALEQKGETMEALRLRAQAVGLGTATDAPTNPLSDLAEPLAEGSLPHRFGRWIHPRSWSA